MEWALYPIDQFQTHCAQWEQLNRNTIRSPLMECDFIVPLIAQFSRGDELLAVCGDVSRPRAMAVLSKVKFGAWTTFQPSQAPTGAWMQESGESVEALSRSLSKSLPGFKLVLAITQQDPALLPRPEDSGHLSTLDYIDTACVTVNQSFEDYWSQRGKNLRQNLRRQRNRLEREETNTQLAVLTDPEEVEPAIAAYGRLETAGWKQENGTAVSADNAQGRFYQAVLENFCRRGKGIIFQYRYDGQLVATDLCILGGESLVILKTTYDEEIKTTSPAMLMRQDAFKTIFDGKLAERIEFYGRVMDWHTRWSSETRTMYHINFYSKLAKLLRRY